MRKLLFILLLSVVLTADVDFFEFLNNGEMIKNVPVNGTIPKSSSVTFTTKDAVNWQDVTFGLQVTGLSDKLFEKIATAKISCDSHKIEFPLESYIPSTRNEEYVDCKGKDTTITITNESTDDISYWAIVADINSIMYDVPDNSFYSNVLPGHSKTEFHSYRVHIGKDEGGSGVIDFVNVTCIFDAFSKSKVTAFFGDSPRPWPKMSKMLNNAGEGVLWTTLNKNDQFFCYDCYLYLHVMVQTSENEPVFYRMQWNVDRDIISLQNNDIFEGTVISDNHGQHFVIDLTKLEYDDDIYIGTRKLDNPDDKITFDVSLTSFDDGEWDTCKTTVNYGNALNEWGIRRLDPCWRLGQVYYVRAWTANEVVKPQKFSIVFRLGPVQTTYLYKGKTMHYQTRQELPSIAYYKIYIPKEEFVDYQSLTVSMSNIFYTSTGSFWYGFDTYYGKQVDEDLPVNPKDPATYSYTTTVNYQNTRSFTLTEDQEGWCTDCNFIFAVRSMKETTWAITAELGYVSFLLQPNEHRSGTLHAYTAGTEMYFYHHQSEYRPVEVAVRKVNEKDPNIVMYIATYPHPDKTNHQWVDTTDADGRADITIENYYPWYCTDCFYYVSVFFMDSEQQGDTSIQIEYNCPDNVCKVCKDGFDPSKDCKECLPGFYGKDCKACKNCNHGTCDSGISGSGKCVCNEGWGPDEVCNTCLEGFWGDQCQKCPSCHSHGKCNDGLKGDGTCKCEGNWDSRVNCDDCKDGFFGLTCEGTCPATTNGVCDNNGDCNDKRTGDGHCVCNTGMVGIYCDTKMDDDKCKPHCVEGHGACDETQGKCQCWGDYTGGDCKREKKTTWITLLIITTVLLLLLLTVMMIVHITKRDGRQGRRNKKEKKPMLGDAESGYKAMD